MMRVFLIFAYFFSMISSFSVRRNFVVRQSFAAFAGKIGPRELFKEFTVQPCSPDLKKELGVERWGVWSTAGSSKYKVGVKSPLKVYDGNELSYIISGKMTITPDEGPNKGIPVPVQAGDFVFFPDGFSCYWFVEETVTKHYYLW